MHVYRTLSTSRAIAVASALALALSFVGCKKTATAPPSDAAITTALHSRLAGDSALSAEPIQSSVENGIATLNGTVSSDAARALAAANAAQVAGIRTVVNNLSVQQPAPPVPVAAVAPPLPIPVPVKRERAPVLKPKPAPIVRQPAPVERAAVEPPPQPSRPVPSSHPAPPPAPTFRNITIPSGTVIPVRITQTLDSATTQLGDKFTGTLATDLVIGGVTALRQGTPVTGRVSDVQEAAHYKGSSLLAIELSSINRRGERITVISEPYRVEGKGRGRNTAEKVGGGAALGAILGGIFGGGKGAAIGAAAGGGVGAGANTITKGEQVQIPSESLIRFRLTNTLALRVSTGNNDSSNNESSPGNNESNSPNPGLQTRPSYQTPQ
ncbi:MAG: BON domain-containing protein [Edaphobacter sp.]